MRLYWTDILIYYMCWILLEKKENFLGKNVVLQEIKSEFFSSYYKTLKMAIRLTRVPLGE